MSSPEVERFEVTDEDLANEFNPNRPTYRQSKNKAIYGMWADDSDEDERPGFSGHGKRNAKDYSAPIGFVSGGVKVGDKVTKNENEEDQEGSDSDDEPPRASFGKTASAGRHRAQKGYRGKKDDIGEWEKNTRGIGAKLLRKMGYVEGKGLGKNLQGISTPVEAKKRVGKGAVGFYGSERTERSLQDFPVQPDSEEEEEKEFREQLHQWKKGEGKKKQKPKYVYRTADDLIAVGRKRKVKVQSELSKVKVIDMTGKEQRVMSGYHALSQKHDKPEEEGIPYSQTQEKKAFDMPELLHNLDLLVEMAEDEILQNSKKLNYDKDVVINLKHEHEKMVDVCQQEEKQIDKLKAVLAVVEKCESRIAPGCEDPLSLEDCASIFKTMQEKYYEEYKMYDLSTMALAIVFPLMKEKLKGWEPLHDPRRGTTSFKAWRDLLEDPNRHYNQSLSDTMDAYERLIWDVWMPFIRTTISTKWSPRDCEGLIEVLEAWMPLLPHWIMGNILEQLVLPKLQHEVEEWNPLTDTMPIHAWLHPWLPLMGERLEPVYAPIRHKLANALKNWHPSDPSAKMILQPWEKVFKPGHMEAFVSKNILPKLGMALGEFAINPSHQQLDVWNWTMAWLDMAPRAGMVALLEKHFFPRWHQVLHSWITSAPNYDEITKWYTGWKSMFPEALINDGAIKEQFNRALDTMNRAVSGHYQPGARENVAYLTSTERRRDYEAQVAQEKRDYEARQIANSGSGASVPTNFKDLIEWKAEQNNIIFLPVPNKYHEAKQVYRFGNVQIVLDRGVVFVQEGQLWMPCSVNELVRRAK